MARVESEPKAVGASLCVDVSCAQCKRKRLLAREMLQMGCELRDVNECGQFALAACVTLSISCSLSSRKFSRRAVARRRAHACAREAKRLHQRFVLADVVRE